MFQLMRFLFSDVCGEKDVDLANCGICGVCVKRLQHPWPSSGTPFSKSKAFFNANVLVENARRHSMILKCSRSLKQEECGMDKNTMKYQSQLFNE